MSVTRCQDTPPHSLTERAEKKIVTPESMQEARPASHSREKSAARWKIDKKATHSREKDMAHIIYHV